MTGNVARGGAQAPVQPLVSPPDVGLQGRPVEHSA
jgi:hypothetical protein